FFVLGLCLKPEHFHLVRRRSVRIAAVPVFAAALAFAWWAAPRMNTGWFYHRDSAQELGAPWWAGPVMVLALFGCSLVLTACFFAWVPGRRVWFTALGAGTLCGYLLHGFVVKAGDYKGWFEVSALQGPFGEILVTVLAAAMVTLLCTAPVRRVFRPVMEPAMDWAFKRDPAEAARERERHEADRTREKVSAGAVRDIPGRPRPPPARREAEECAHARVLLGQPRPGGLVQHRQPRRVGVVRQVRLLHQQRAGGGPDAGRVRLGRLPRPLGDRADDVLGPRRQGGPGQPVLGQPVVLDGVVQPGRRDLLRVAAARPYARGDGAQMLGVGAAGLVGLAVVRGAGDGFDLGHGQVRRGAAWCVCHPFSVHRRVPVSGGRRPWGPRGRSVAGRGRR